MGMTKDELRAKLGMAEKRNGRTRHESSLVDAVVEHAGPRKAAGNMRRSLDGLALWIQEKLGRNPRMTNVMFVFFNRRRDMMKALWRDATA